MKQRKELLKYLKKAAELIVDEEDDFKESIEDIVLAVRIEGKEGDFMAAMVYAAGEVINNR